MPNPLRFADKLLSLALALALTACGGSTVEAPSCAGVTELPVIPSMFLDSPPSGTTAADNLSVIVVAFSFPQSGWDMTLQSPDASLNLGPLGPPPANLMVPASPDFPTPTYYGVAAPALNAATTYTVTLTYTLGPCFPTPNLGSFTTK